MKYAFVAQYRPTFSVRRMCRCLSIHPSGFYAWVKNPLSLRAHEDARQTKRLQKKHDRKWGVRGMRYPTSEKLEIIRTVEGSHLPVKQILDMLCIPRSTFYRWCDHYLDGGLDALADHPPRPRSIWNRIPDVRRDDLIEFALEHEALNTRELAVKYTDEKKYFISESSAYRILKAADLITAPDYVVIKAADEFKDKTTVINEMWQTDFTYFKIIGWG